MFSRHQNLSDRQVNSFISFLIDGTDKAIIALEEVFGLDVDRSNSDIEIAPSGESEFLQHLNGGELFAVHANMSGDLDGNIMLLLRRADFRYLGDVMKPVLNLLFLADPDGDLESLEQGKPDWMQDEICPMPDDESFQRNMMDLLAELGNVLIGRYAKSLFHIFRLTMHHTVPTVRRTRTRDLFGPPGGPGEALHVVIENEFQVGEHPIRIWCLISPSRSSFEQLLGQTRH